MKKNQRLIRPLKVLEMIVEHDMFPYQVSAGSMQITKRQMTEIITEVNEELFHLAYARDVQGTEYYTIHKHMIPIPLQSK